MYEVEFHLQALKSILALPRETALAVQREINVLAQSGEHLNAKNPLGRPGYRLHVGDCRVLYSKDQRRDKSGGKARLRILAIRDSRLGEHHPLGEA